MTGEHYASGNWHVKAGSENEFIARWQTFITESAKTAEGFGSARLLRDGEDPRRFLSFSDWADAATREAWKSSPAFEKASPHAGNSGMSSSARTTRKPRASDRGEVRLRRHPHVLLR